MAEKIQFANSDAGAGAYTLTYNPSELELNQDDAYSDFPVLDDAPVKQSWAFDGRDCEMSWDPGLEVSHPDMALQVTEIDGYKGDIKYIKFRAAAYGEYDADTWYKFRIINFSLKIRRGGKIKWREMRLIFRREA